MNYEQKVFWNGTVLRILGHKSASTWRIEPVTSFMQGKKKTTFDSKMKAAVPPERLTGFVSNLTVSDTSVLS
jgi:hypothetical protein